MVYCAHFFSLHLFPAGDWFEAGYTGRDKCRHVPLPRHIPRILLDANTRPYGFHTGIHLRRVCTV